MRKKTISAGEKSILIMTAVSFIIGCILIMTMNIKHPKMWGVGLILVVAAGIHSVSYMRQRKARLILNNRESLNDDQIYCRFYAVSGFEYDRVKELWHEVANILAVPFEKLRPSDKFGEELGGWNLITSDDLDALALTMKARAETFQKSIDLSIIYSLDDYIRWGCDINIISSVSGDKCTN